MPNNYLPTTYQEFIHLSRYSRWLPEEERRETWDETVARYFDFFTEHLKETVDFTLTLALRQQLEQAVLGLRVMPSMRCIMTAGEALKRENIAGYNCSYVAVDRPQAFDEILYILMNGTGVGFSVERQYVSQLPTIADEFHETDTTITVADSKLGWAKALKELIGMLYIGQIPRWDLSKIRTGQKYIYFSRTMSFNLIEKQIRIVSLKRFLKVCLKFRGTKVCSICSRLRN